MIKAPDTVYMPDNGEFPIVIREPKYEVRKSSILNAGDGVFVLEPVDANIVMFEYTGDLISCSDLTSEQTKISLDVKYELCIVGTQTAIKINDCIKVMPLDEEKTRNLIVDETYEVNVDASLKPYTYNCVFLIVGEGVFARAYIMSLRQIEAGEELFIAYGSGYWTHHFQAEGLIKKETVSSITAELRKIQTYGL